MNPTRDRVRVRPDPGHAKGPFWNVTEIDPVALRGRHQLNRVGGVLLPLAGFEKG